MSYGPMGRVQALAMAARANAETYAARWPRRD
jgi:hypothetical protein